MSHSLYNNKSIIPVTNTIFRLKIHRIIHIYIRTESKDALTVASSNNSAQYSATKDNRERERHKKSIWVHVLGRCYATPTFSSLVHPFVPAVAANKHQVQRSALGSLLSLSTSEESDSLEVNTTAR